MPGQGWEAVIENKDEEYKTFQDTTLFNSIFYLLKGASLEFCSVWQLKQDSRPLHPTGNSPPWPLPVHQIS